MHLKLATAVIYSMLIGSLAQTTLPDASQTWPTSAWRGSAPHDKGNAVGIASVPEAANPLLAAGQFPQWDKIQPEHIQPAVQQLIREETASLQLLEQDLLAAGDSISFDSIFTALTQIRLRVDSVSGQTSHLSNVVSSDELRAAIEAVTPALVAFDLQLGQSKAIYNSLNTLKSVPAKWEQLSPEQQRLVARTLTEMSNSGVGLQPEQRSVFNDLKNQLEVLQNQFSNNVLDAKGAFKLLVTDKSELAGLGATTMALAAQNAQVEGYTAASSTSGPWLLKLDTNTYAAVMTSAHSRELRQRFYQADRTSASSGEFDNSELVQKILSLRQELAALLGYKNWGDYKATSRMATIQQATALMEQMVEASKPAAAHEHQELTAFARAATQDPDLQLQWWDVEYYAERQKEAKFNLKQEELQQYLPLDSVIKGLFELAERVYGVTITPLQDKPPVWHSYVQVYQVTNIGSSKPIAYFYTDLFARPGFKSGGAWEHGLLSGAKLWQAPSPAAVAASQLPPGAALYSPKLAEAQAAWLAAAPAVLPAVIIVCNQNPPVGGRPSLMSLREVETLFHEFGHASQDMLTTSQHGLTAGIRNIELDAVEIPSMHQEKWVYDGSVFTRLARHWKTGAPLPESMFKQIAGLHKYRAGTMYALQMTKTLTDLKLHSEYVPNDKVSAHDVYLDTFSKIAPMPPWQGDRFINQFRHLFYYGYEAGYYSYYWADVQSADIHGAFVEAGMEDAAAMKQMGQRYRDTFLSLGGSVAPQEVFKRFMGREPTIERWLKYNGLA